MATADERMYVTSPFGYSGDATDFTRGTAIAMTAVFGIIMITGLIGHIYVISFYTCRIGKTNRHAINPLLINLSFTHLIYCLVCLPAMAYNAVSSLVTEEWLLGDVACRTYHFLQVVIVIVTSFTFIALCIDLFRSISTLLNNHERLTEGCCRSLCKIVVLWMLAILLASPELLMYEVTQKMAPSMSQQPASMSAATDGWQIDARKFKSIITHPNVSSSSSETAPEPLTVAYYTCGKGFTTWQDDFPLIILTTMESYSRNRHWWLLSVCFCFPVFFTLIFAVINSSRTSSAVRDISSPIINGSHYVSYGDHPTDGTLTSLQRQYELDHPSVKDNLSYPSDSLLSSRTRNSDNYYQQRALYHPGVNSNNHFSTRLSPVLSHPEHPEMNAMFPQSNGSIRTTASFRPQASSVSNEAASPSSPFSITCLSGVSIVSLNNTNAYTASAVGGAGNTASLPPHGRGRSFRRRSSRVMRQILSNAALERSINTLVVSILLAFTVTQLPQHVASVLEAETHVWSRMDSGIRALVSDLCCYFVCLTFIINPVIMCMCHNIYRRCVSDCLCCCFSQR